MRMKWCIAIITTSISIVIALAVLKKPCEYMIGHITCSRSGKEVLFYYEPTSGGREQQMLKVACKTHRDVWQSALDDRNNRNIYMDGRYMMLVK